ncbi:MAG TPA: glycosyltransferase [Solirubrobacteraceae bacterium]|nr:glycosyltransferase [Solirubrobacteraceae bacterium]
MSAPDATPPALSVVICSRDGAAGVERCLGSLDAQRATHRLQVIVVDDGSSDHTSDVARRAGATLVRHDVGRGLAASRNDGIRRAEAEIVAFLDDDCEAAPDWAERLLAAFAPGVAGAGGEVRPAGATGYMLGFLSRNNPLAPLEAALGRSASLPYRLGLYLRDQLAIESPGGRRPVNALVGANMAFRRSVLEAVGLFDERFTFGAEELDLCWRVTARYPELELVVDPSIVVTHHFRPGLRDGLRRARSYGRGTARLYRKWPRMRPTVYPWPLVALALALAALRDRRWAPAAAAWPLLAYPRAVRHAARDRAGAPLLDAYVRLGEEHLTNIGFAAGAWEFRDLQPEAL